MSKTEKAKHYHLFLPKHKTSNAKPAQNKTKLHNCNFKESDMKDNAVFLSYHKLKQHKDLALHKNAETVKATKCNFNTINIKAYFKYDKLEEEFSVDKNEEVCAVCGC